MPDNKTLDFIIRREEINEKVLGEDDGWTETGNSFCDPMSELIDSWNKEKRLTLVCKNDLNGSTAVLVPAKRAGSSKRAAILTSRVWKIYEGTE